MKKYLLLTLVLLNLSSSYGNDIDFTLSQYKIRQGETLKITINTNKDLKNAKLAFNNKKYEIFKENKNKYVSYLGISRKLKPKKYPIAIKGTIDKKPFYKRKAIIVLKGHFKKSIVKLKGKKRTLSKNYSAISKEASNISKILKSTRKDRLFTTFFKTPTKGKITTRFGAYREYNGVAKGKHAGVDYANKIGTRVFASNSGIVELSEFMDIHGHTIIIDHGWGIKTIYNHLHKRYVKKGDKVSQKTIIGEIGNTGISTGPHLHWGMSIQDIRVDPLFWLKKDFLY